MACGPSFPIKVWAHQSTRKERERERKKSLMLSLSYHLSWLFSSLFHPSLFPSASLFSLPFPLPLSSRFSWVAWCWNKLSGLVFNFCLVVGDSLGPRDVASGPAGLSPAVKNLANLGLLGESFMCRLSGQPGQESVTFDRECLWNSSLYWLYILHILSRLKLVFCSLMMRALPRYISRSSWFKGTKKHIELHNTEGIFRGF